VDLDSIRDDLATVVRQAPEPGLRSACNKAALRFVREMWDPCMRRGTRAGYTSRQRSQ
jgi:hypothetical protein